MYCGFCPDDSRCKQCPIEGRVLWKPKKEVDMSVSAEKSENGVYIAVGVTFQTASGKR